jgi:predicted alpha-1,2-mannosidase
MARFTYPASKAASVILNAGGSADGNREAVVHIDPVRHEVSGSTSSGSFCSEPDHYKVYFVAQFNRRFEAYGTWHKQQLASGSTANEDRDLGDPFTTVTQSGPTAQSGAYATFDTTSARTVEVRLAISYVSVANARRNLRTESAKESFDAIRARARRVWNNALNTVQVRAGSLPQLGRFYTALYQTLIEPSIFSDTDGSYMGMDGKVHIARGYTQYADFSGWDVYRSQMPLLAILQPKEASDIAQSFIADSQQSGWLPKWSVANGQTGVMTGDPADPIIASIYAFGARGFDSGAALLAMVKGGTQLGRSPNDGYVERQALPEYLRFGYIPYEFDGNNLTTAFLDNIGGVAPRSATAQLAQPWGSAGTTLEYAVDDFAVSQLAGALGETALCRAFLSRSGNWRNLFNHATGYIEPRSASGMFLPGYDPNYNDSLSSRGFPEGDAAQYTWMIPHDPAGLISALGGRVAATKRLDFFFTKLNTGVSSPYAFLGNEPSLNSPWLYDWLGEPFKTQQVLRRALLELYPGGPGGFPGNDDLGQMSSWYVLAALGLYPESPGTDLLALSSPLFPDITLHIGKGDIRLRAPQAAPDVPYVKSLTIDGHLHHQPWIHFAAMHPGSTLDFTLSAKPEPSWGARPEDAPPSFGPNDIGVCGRARS